MNIAKLKQMIKEPASKEWFKKHGSPKGKAIEKYKRTAEGKIILPKRRPISEAERKERTKNWPKSSNEKIDSVAYQSKFKRAYND
jgi:hypothetical protein